MSALVLVAMLGLGAAETDSPVLVGLELSGGARKAHVPRGGFETAQKVEGGQAPAGCSHAFNSSD